MSTTRIIVIAAHPLSRKGIEAIITAELPGVSLMFLSELPSGFAFVPETCVPETCGITATLSPRELEIFGILGQEITVRIIARRLGISVKTVESHRENIKNKLGVQCASEVVDAASRWLLSKRSPIPQTSE